MDSAKLILTEPVLPPTPLGQLETSGLDSISDEDKKQVAKDFESVLLNKLLDDMQQTIGDWGFEKDGPFKQVQGIFFLYLARDLANHGGIGLWKDIFGFLSRTDHNSTTVDSLEASL